ncbi:DUF1194 domain-containing protein [Microvirga guangxiensis]|uniref:VWFA domain-containing protein n=1 Tax=Microvirga guangxiensis TaxID=549386 RepID=A0A1G5LQ21_9HYPH|nr:DUF1194 domain-containing protein [Microvirga guangxiensis]SCZ14561.1 Protein of unknown function [Microvirga guangxiensis]
MLHPVRVLWLSAFVWVVTLLPIVPAQAQTEVDLALVLAVDISYSMDMDEQELQREGFAEAFRSPLVHDAIRNGMLGRIGVTYMEWAGLEDQKVIIPWTVLDNSESLMAFADRITSTPLRRAQRTSVSGAIDAAAKLFENSGLEANRKVIDVSGDGANNQGRPVTHARDEAVARGITINGLPIMLKKPGSLDDPDLDIYFRDCVIGGQGAFMVPAREKEQFQQAIKTKIILEVSGLLSPPAPLVTRAQSRDARADCMAGETRWRDRTGN